MLQVSELVVSEPSVFAIFSHLSAGPEFEPKSLFWPSGMLSLPWNLLHLCLNSSPVQDRWILLCFWMVPPPVNHQRPAKHGEVRLGQREPWGKVLSGMWLVHLDFSDSSEHSTHYGTLCCASHGRTVGFALTSLSLRVQSRCIQKCCRGLPEALALARSGSHRLNNSFLGSRTHGTPRGLPTDPVVRVATVSLLQHPFLLFYILCVRLQKG